MRFFPLLLLVFYGLQAQTERKVFPSQRMNEERNIRIKLPDRYGENPGQTYPLIIVFDGEYLFNPVASIMDYYMYWGDMPGTVVVGIDMEKTRSADTAYDDINFVPEKDGLAFFEFVTNELMPWLEVNYRLADFRVVVGHDRTANLLNYFLLVKPPLFQGYVSLSPDIAPLMEERLVNVFNTSKTPVDYFLATAKDDIRELRKKILSLDGALNKTSNREVDHKFVDYDDATHYSLPARAIPQAFAYLFAAYRPIVQMDYDAIIADKERNPFEALEERYDKSEKRYGARLKMRVNDLMAIAEACLQLQDYGSLKELGKLAEDEYPQSMMGDYYMGLVYEFDGDWKQAIKSYEAAFIKLEIGDITKDMVFKRMEKLKKEHEE